MKMFWGTGFCCALLSLSSCGASHKDKVECKAQTDGVEQADTTRSYLGSYEGTLPCADASGKKTELTFNEDMTYDLVYKYEDKEDDEINENGVYELVGDSLLVLRTPSSGTKTYYRIVEEGVALTDSTGILNTGELASFYVLKRK